MTSLRASRFTFTALDDFTTVQVETSNIQEFDSDGSEKKGTRTKARPILAIYKDRGPRCTCARAAPASAPPSRV